MHYICILCPTFVLVACCNLSCGLFLCSRWHREFSRPQSYRGLSSLWKEVLLSNQVNHPWSLAGSEAGSAEQASSAPPAWKTLHVLQNDSALRRGGGSVHVHGHFHHRTGAAACSEGIRDFGACSSMCYSQCRWLPEPSSWSWQVKGITFARDTISCFDTSAEKFQDGLGSFEYLGGQKWHMVHICPSRRFRRLEWQRTYRTSRVNCNVKTADTALPLRLQVHYVERHRRFQLPHNIIWKMKHCWQITRRPLITIYYMFFGPYSFYCTAHLECRRKANQSSDICMQSLNSCWTLGACTILATNLLDVFSFHQDTHLTRDAEPNPSCLLPSHWRNIHRHPVIQHRSRAEVEGLWVQCWSSCQRQQGWSDGCCARSVRAVVSFSYGILLLNT